MGTAVVFETRRPFLGFTLRTGLRIGGDNAMCAALAALVLLIGGLPPPCGGSARRP
jgi:hypothetical protein